MVKEIDSAQLQERMVAGEEVHLVDIRSAPEVVHGMLPNATHLPMHLIPLQVHEFPQDKEVVLYCRSGARSYHACAYLMQQGFTNVINLRGGIIAWARHGYEIKQQLAS